MGQMNNSMQEPLRPACYHTNFRSRPSPPPAYCGRTYDIDLAVELLSDSVTTFIQATLDS